MRIRANSNGVLLLKEQLSFSSNDMTLLYTQIKCSVARFIAIFQCKMSLLIASSLTQFRKRLAKILKQIFLSKYKCPNFHRNIAAQQLYIDIHYFKTTAFLLKRMLNFLCKPSCLPYLNLYRSSQLTKATYQSIL